MRKHDAHVREFRRMLLKNRYPWPTDAVFVFIFFIFVMGFYLGYTYATATYDLFNIQNECLRVIREIKF